MNLYTYEIGFWYSTDRRDHKVVKAFNSMQALAIACGEDEMLLNWCNEIPFTIKIRVIS